MWPNAPRWALPGQGESIEEAISILQGSHGNCTLEGFPAKAGLPAFAGRTFWRVSCSMALKFNRAFSGKLDGNPGNSPRKLWEFYWKGPGKRGKAIGG